MDCKLIVLDFDGTLADTRPLIVATMQRVIKELGLPGRSEAECVATIGLPLRECFVRLFPQADADRCVERYRVVFEEGNRPGVVVPFPHVEQTLHGLRAAGYRMAICSSRSRPSLLDFVERMGLGGCVEMVVSAGDVAHAKPHPESVWRVMERLGVPPVETLVVGDASYDMLMGRAAGCRTCGVTYGNQSAEELTAAGAEWLIDDFADLVRVVQGTGS